MSLKNYLKKTDEISAPKMCQKFADHFYFAFIVQFFKNLLNFSWKFGDQRSCFREKMYVFQIQISERKFQDLSKLFL